MIYGLIIVIAGTMALDRVVKMLVTNGFSVGESVPVIGDFFHITYVRNTGVAFSLLEGRQDLILIITAVLLTAALVYLIIFHRKHPPVFSFGLALVCGGGLSNVIDRKAYGYVIDMFDFGSFPVFNVADICICVGCGLMLLYALRSIKD